MMKRVFWMLFSLCCVVIGTVPVNSSAVASEVSSDMPKSTSELTVQISGLKGEMVLVLNNDEKLVVVENGTNAFDKQFEVGDKYNVMIKSMPVNQDCKLENMSGAVGETEALIVEAECRDTGKWEPASILVEKTVLKARAMYLFEPRAAIDPKGNVVALWGRLEKDQMSRLVRRENLDGKWLDPVPMGPPAGTIRNPQVVMAENGDVVVVWEHRENRNNFIMMAERRNGKWQMPASTADRISVDDKYAWEADVSISDSGETVITWSQETKNGVHAVYKSEYRDGKWHNPKDLDDYISPQPQKGNDALRPQVAINNKGDVIIAWEQAASNGSRIFKSERRGNKWSHPADINDYINPETDATGRGGAYAPLVAMDQSGNAVIGWQQINQAKQWIYLSEYRNGAWHNPGSIDQAVNPAEMVNTRIHDLKMNSKGNTLLLWTAAKDSRDSLYKTEFREGKWFQPSEDEPIVSAPNEWEFKVFGKGGISDGGRAFIAWHQRGADRIGKMYLAEYNHNSWYFPGQLLNVNDKPATGLDVFSSPNGSRIVVWLQRDGKKEQVYGRIFRVIN